MFYFERTCLETSQTNEGEVRLWLELENQIIQNRALWVHRFFRNYDVTDSQPALFSVCVIFWLGIIRLPWIMARWSAFFRYFYRFMTNFTIFGSFVLCIYESSFFVLSHWSATRIIWLWVFLFMSHFFEFMSQNYKISFLGSSSNLIHFSPLLSLLLFFPEGIDELDPE